MSQWSSIEARFVPAESTWRLTEDFVMEGVPRGSEDGPASSMYRGSIYVEGRLRDFGDLDAPRALAWWIGRCADGPIAEGELMIDVDSGPRYRWRFSAAENPQVTRLRGVLD